MSQATLNQHESTQATHTLSEEQASFLRQNGYVVLPNAVSPQLVGQARRAINAAMGQGIPADELRTWSSQTFFPALSRSEPISDLFNESDVLPALRGLMGEGRVSRAGGGQIALRFPRELGVEAGRPHPHVDGMYSPNNGVPKGTLSSFTALAGVFLSDVASQDAGNFCVWPGTHRLFSEYFREHGAKALLEENKLPPIEMPEPVQITARPGDAVIAHYLLAHGVAPNVSPDVRYAIFFRVSVPEHKEQRVEVLTDIWREWPGLASG